MGETEPSLMVNWYEVEIFDTAKNKVIYKNKSSSFFIGQWILDDLRELIAKIAEAKEKEIPIFVKYHRNLRSDEAFTPF